MRINLQGGLYIRVSEQRLHGFWVPSGLHEKRRDRAAQIVKSPSDFVAFVNHPGSDGTVPFISPDRRKADRMCLLDCVPENAIHLSDSASPSYL